MIYRGCPPVLGEDELCRGPPAAAIRSGMVSINHHGLALPEVPFGVISDSGNATEGGADALEGYLNTKFVSQMHA